MSAEARLVVVLGPTGAGKSALGIWLAERLGGEVVVCDSTQVYRHFDIGTAKVRREERRGIPHHLMDLVEPDELFTAGEYRRRALAVLAELRERGKVPVLTAGTGLYLRALLEGLADAPLRSEAMRARLREKAKRKGDEYLHRLLKRLDPDAAARIGPRDIQKVTRAVEICILAGKPVSEVHRAGREPLEGYRVRKIGLLPPRAELYARIEERVTIMLQQGWLEEVKQLIAQGIPPTAKAFQFIGYAELQDHLRGKSGRVETVRQIQQATRRYAKRQVTWFRKEAGVKWFTGFGETPEVQAGALGFLEEGENGGA
ncbi:MAG TPA: tRNA (adenosine(37)-N6)-dimethylallyltransferase MiaA [Candidatus Acidoferrales bacterium]|jgi:tRNA dimethylallyltransferase|nr:tRNA (adenosine(37)-N6)-dimethylallyltransferase MiaA [Candidatus Acidoferrales bacterium]